MSNPTHQALAKLTPRGWIKLLPGLSSARRAVRRAWATGLRRDPLIKPSEWAQRYRVVAEGTSAHAGKWDNARTPFLVEIMDRMSPGDPAKRITLMKSVQVSGSEGISNILGWIIDVAPGPTLVVHPTIEAGRDWTVEKFEPAIEATPRVARKVRAVVIRGRDGSTLKRKQFPGGSIVVTGGNSAAGLRQKSIRNLILDDVDEFPLEVGGQGDPVEMARARKTSFEKSGQDKELDVSTPTTKATSRVAKQYEAGTQGRWHVPCPHCELEQVLEFGANEALGLKFNAEAPHRAHYICKSDKRCRIEHWQLEGMNARGRWIHAMPFPGREPSYHLNSLISPFTTWDHIAAKWIEAQGDPEKLKTFINLQLGEPWDEAADRPKVAELVARRETWEPGAVPPGVLFITLTGDVQGDGIWYRFMGWGRDRQSWGLQHGFLPGATGTVGGAAFVAFDALRAKRFRDEFGNDRAADVTGIDANYETEVVVEFCKTRLNCYPLRGEDGWKQPLWTNKPTHREHSDRGKARKRGPKTFPVGTWTGKRRFYGALAVKVATLVDGSTAYPPAFQHFGQDWTEDDFKQLLSEVYAERRHRKTGKVTRGWHQVESDNHLLDCTVYGYAMAEKLGMSTKSPAEWEWLERYWRRRALEQRELFDAPEQPDPPPAAASLAAPAADEPDEPPADAPAAVTVMGGERRSPADDETMVLG
jgi:phage terminase large subunit GpA-like protein